MVSAGATMENLNQHLAIYDSYEKVKEGAWGPFMQGLAAAVARDLKVVRDDVFPRLRSNTLAVVVHMGDSQTCSDTKRGALVNFQESADPRSPMRNGDWRCTSS